MARISSDPIANYRGHIGKISYYIRECENMARKSLSAGKISDSPANAFMSLNKETCTQEDDTLTVDYEQLQCAQGSLTEPDITATYNTSTSKIMFENTAMEDLAYCNADDKTYGGACEHPTREVITHTSGVMPFPAKNGNGKPRDVPPNSRP